MSVFSFIKLNLGVYCSILLLRISMGSSLINVGILARGVKLTTGALIILVYMGIEIGGTIGTKTVV